MAASIPDKNLRTLLRKYRQLVISRTTRHLRISHPETGGFVIAPISGSDWRGLKNLDRDLRHLCSGVGYGQRKLHA